MRFYCDRNPFGRLGLIMSLLVLVIWTYTECSTDTKTAQYKSRVNMRISPTYKTLTAMSKIDCCSACNLDDKCASVNFK